MSHSIMIMGKDGQTGRELCKIVQNPIIVSHGNDIRKNEVNFEREGQLTDIINKYDPDIIINTVAITSVDKCQKEQSLAYRVNAMAVKEMAQASMRAGAKLVHISTDYVFGGKTGLYDENSVPDPINFYGLSKLMGDCYADSLKDSIIVRTSGVYGHSGNYPRFVYNSLREGREINAIKGYYSPIHAANLARAIMKLVEKDYSGVVNVAGERVSRYEFAKQISQFFDLTGTIKESENVVNMTAPRPFDTSLNLDLAKSLLDFNFYSMDSNLKAFAESLGEQ